MELVDICYEALDRKLADDLVILDFRKTSPFLDYFLIATARNYRLALSLIDEIEDVSAQNGYDVKSKTIGDSDSKWVLIDLGEVVCHIFVGEEERHRYDLEGLWKDLVVKK